MIIEEKKMETITNQIENKQLYKLAWFFEIFAVLIGIYLAVSLSIGGIGNEPQAQDWINFAGIVLILLFGAFIELTKIPFIEAFNKTSSNNRKAGLVLVLICLCVFTFDTLFQGTEQFINFREKPIEKVRIEMIAAEGKIDNIDEQIRTTPLPTDEEIYEGFNLSFNEQAKTLDDEIARLEADKAKLENPADTPEIAELKEQRDMLIQKNNNTEEKQHAAKKEHTEQLKILANSGRKAQRRIPALEKQWEVENQQFNKKIKQTEVFIGVINLRIQELIKIQVAPNQGKIDKIELDLIEQRTAKEDLLSTSQERLDIKIAQVFTNRGIVKDLKANKELLDDSYQILRDEFHEKAQENNIYRIGQRWFGEAHPADLTKEQISLITMFLMIVTASVFTFIGPSAAYFSLRANKKRDEASKHQKGMLMKSIRGLLINIRKKVREPKIVKEVKEVEVVKEVFKEVPVEKTVIKEVEVPKPFEVTRYVGIPVPKDPEDLIEISNAAELELTPAAALSGVK